MAEAAPSASSSARWTEAVIDAVVPRTARVVSVFLRAAISPHLAGQHIDVRLTAPDGYAAQRSYSIASAPGRDTIELLIEKLDDGEVSPYFFEVAQPGDAIEIRGPLGGHFVWRADDGGPLLLIAGGSGVAPLLAIVRYRKAAAANAPTLLLYSARSWDELIYRDELLALADPTFQFIAITTRDAPRRVGDFGRRIDRDILQQSLARWTFAPALSYICGATTFVEAAAQALVAEGIPARLIRTERYGGAD